jgi:hypothetical protein
MRFNGFDNVHEEEERYAGIIAGSLRKTQWSVVHGPLTNISAFGGGQYVSVDPYVTFLTDVDADLILPATCRVSNVQVIDPSFSVAAAITFDAADVFAAMTGVVCKPNLAKESIIQQIEQLPESADYYDSDENPPDRETKEDAKNLIRSISPSGLLAGGDVYAYYGDVNVTWETQRKKLKLIVPSHDRQARASLYHGQMEGGRVTTSDTEHNVTADRLRTWLDWFAG